MELNWVLERRKYTWFITCHRTNTSDFCKCVPNSNNHNTTFNPLFTMILFCEEMLAQLFRQVKYMITWSWSIGLSRIPIYSNTVLDHNLNESSRVKPLSQKAKAHKAKNIPIRKGVVTKAESMFPVPLTSKDMGTSVSEFLWNIHYELLEMFIIVLGLRNCPFIF